MAESRIPDLIRQAALHALANATTLLPEWLPKGSRQGREWVAPNVARGDRQAGSFGVSLDSGKWNDFADSAAHGGDLVSLLAYLRGCRQGDAAREIDQRLGLGLFEALARGDGQPSADALATRQRLEQQQRDAEAQLQDKQAAAARQAALLWQHGKPVDRLHTYLQAKQVEPFGLRQISHGRLAVPLVLGGRLVNLQIIDGQGNKRFLAGGRVQGCYCPLGKVQDGARLYICEGWATGATLHHHTGAPVVCALNAGNLKPVALAMRERFGRRVELVIAGDDDRHTLGNPGRAAANRAAAAAEALVVFPDWPYDGPAELSDFNDLHLWQSGRWEVPA